MLKDDDPGSRAFTLFRRPHPGAFSQLMCPHPREFAHFFKKNANARGGGGGMAGFVQVMENLESHGIYDFNFQAWKVMQF